MAALDHTTTTVNLTNAFQSPVVIARPASYNGSHEVAVRVKNVTSTSFGISLDEPLNRDGPHTTETVHYTVIEAGAYTFPDGTMLEAGTLSANGLGWQTVSLQMGYPAVPAIFTHVQTDSFATPFLHTRQRNATTTQFQVKLERDEVRNSNAPNGPEQIGYFAIQKKTGVLDSVVFEAGSFSADEVVVNHPFTQNFAPGLHFIASVATYNGGNPVTIRRTGLTNTTVSSFLDEDTSNDSETNHLLETVDFFAIDNNGSAGIFLRNPLAIELLSFEARANPQGEAELNWTTTLAIEPSEYFVVERSPDAWDWEEVVIVREPAQRTLRLVRFAFTDDSPLPGTSFYRLRQIELSGLEALSSIRQVTLSPQNAPLILFPNPATSTLSLTGFGGDPGPIEFYNLIGQNWTGRVPLRSQSRTEMTWDLTRLPPGTYWLKLPQGALKFIKQ